MNTIRCSIGVPMVAFSGYNFIPAWQVGDQHGMALGGFLSVVGFLLILQKESNLPVDVPAPILVVRRVVKRSRGGGAWLLILGVAAYAVAAMMGVVP